MLGLGLLPSLILLRREPRLIALSNLERYAIPARTRLGLEWLLQPNDPDVLQLPAWRRMSDYQLCFWYALEMERRHPTELSSDGLANSRQPDGHRQPRRRIDQCPPGARGEGVPAPG